MNLEEDIHTTVAARVFGVDSSQVTKQQRAFVKHCCFGNMSGSIDNRVASVLTAIQLLDMVRMSVEQKTRLMSPSQRRFYIRLLRYKEARLLTLGQREEMSDLQTSYPDETKELERMFAEVNLS